LTNVVKGLDDFVQTYNFQNPVQPGGGAEQLQFSSSFFKRDPVPNQTSDSLAVNDADAATVQQQALATFVGKALKSVSNFGHVLDCQSLTQLQQSDRSDIALTKNERHLGDL